MKNIRNVRRILSCEQLETRFVLSNLGPSLAPDAFSLNGVRESQGVIVLTETSTDDVSVPSVEDMGEFQAVIVAGDPSLGDSPSNREDANTDTSPFAGVGSLQITANRGTFICTGTPFDSTHVLTAGHCVDLNNDGKSDKKDGIRSITFNLNAGGNLTSQIKATSWDINPDFTGFNHPSVNDDLAVITLSSSVPVSVPTYSLATSDMAPGATQLYMVGYGRSGDGVNGYTTNASFTIKRKGENIADAFYTQDDGGKPGANEVFRFDFDGVSGNGTFGGPTLGNAKETTLGGGDSGGPSFVLCTSCDPTLASSYKLAGVNTFTQGTNAPKFGSLGGGINVFPYEAWILGSHGASASSGGGSGGNGGGPPAGNVLGASDDLFLIVPPADSASPSLPPLPSAESILETTSTSTGDIGESLESHDASVGSPHRGSQVIVVSSSPDSIESPANGSNSHNSFTEAVDSILARWAVDGVDPIAMLV